MKFTPIAAAALIPSTVAGIAFSIMPFVNGSTTAQTLTAHVTARHAAHAVSHVGTPAHHATAAAARSAAVVAQPATTQPPADSQPAAAATGPATATSNQPLTAGMSAFEQCVAWRESGDNPTASSAGLFGILPYVWQSLGYSGTAGQASVAQQEAAFNQLYAQYGAQPWAPSDGC
jgi:hypothetical protein